MTMVIGMGTYRKETDDSGAKVLCLCGAWDDGMTTALLTEPFDYLKLEQISDWPTYYAHVKAFADRVSNIQRIDIAASAKTARMRNFNWLSRMANLRDAAIHDISVEEPLDWRSVLSLPHLTRLSVDLPEGYKVSDEELRAVLATVGKTVESIDRIRSTKGRAVRLWEISPQRGATTISPHPPRHP